MIKPKGWHRESARHSLASKGVKTKQKMTPNIIKSKRDIIFEIERIDAEKGHFHPNGQYRYGVKFYYGKLEKYPKEKLIKILEHLKK